MCTSLVILPDQVLSSLLHVDKHITHTKNTTPGVKLREKHEIQKCSTFFGIYSVRLIQKSAFWLDRLARHAFSIKGIRRLVVEQDCR